MQTLCKIISFSLLVLRELHQMFILYSVVYRIIFLTLKFATFHLSFYNKMNNLATRTCCVVSSRGWRISSSTGPRGITISSPCTFNLIWNRSKDVLINSTEKEFYELKPVLCTHSIHLNEKFRSSSYKLTVNNPTRSWDFQIPLSPVCERNRNPNRKIPKPHWKPNPKPIRPKTIC